jgi:hypothetical protein
VHIFPIIAVDVFLSTLAFGIIFCQIETEVSSPCGFYLLMTQFGAL